MDNWRNQRSNYYNEEVTRTTGLQNRKPPLGNGQAAALPSWEKKFCTVVSSIPWKDFIEAKKYVNLYDNILQWNDSAGEEAFQNAKNRFWAELNGFPCETSVPGPDLYIDDIDWDSKVDPELDLENDFLAPDGERIVLVGGPLDRSHLFTSDGWGDAEDKWKDSDNKVNSWEQNGGNGWGDVCADSWRVNEAPKDNVQSCWGWEEPQNGSKMNQNGNLKGKNNNYGGFWDSNNREVSNPSRYMSRYKTSRFQGGDQTADRESRNRRKRLNDSYQRPAQWRPANPRNRWSSDKPVSGMW